MNMRPMGSKRFTKGLSRSGAVADAERRRRQREITFRSFAGVVIIYALLSVVCDH